MFLKMNTFFFALSQLLNILQELERQMNGDDILKANAYMLLHIRENRSEEARSAYSSTFGGHKKLRCASEPSSSLPREICFYGGRTSTRDIVGDM